MVVVVLMSLIVIALMSVFSGTQRALRSTVTQVDVLEGGRATMDLITADLRQMTPSLEVSNPVSGAVNFYVIVNPSASLQQSLNPAPTQVRTYVLENFFIMRRENKTWTGTGYVVDTSSSSPINPLYRFSMSTNVAAASPATLLNIFTNTSTANMSHLLDGVVGLRVRAFDTAGQWMTANVLTSSGGQTITNENVLYSTPQLGETGFSMFSNTLPASVEIEMAKLEDRTLQRAESFPPGSTRTTYLQGQAGNVHIFHQRVSIPNLDPAAYP